MDQLAAELQSWSPASPSQVTTAKRQRFSKRSMPMHRFFVRDRFEARDFARREFPNPNMKCPLCKFQSGHIILAMDGCSCNEKLAKTPHFLHFSSARKLCRSVALCAAGNVRMLQKTGSLAGPCQGTPTSQSQQAKSAGILFILANQGSRG